MSNTALTQAQPSEHRQIPALDGIRAIAIFGVFLFHVCPQALPGGFAGVDVFFVLSGFLITSIIYHDIQNRNFSFKEFYLRRIQRLLPNSVLAVGTSVLLWWLFLPAGLETTTAKHGIWTIFNLSNFYIKKYVGGYWGESAEWMPLTHFWSLGVEEQFYILFPALLFLLIKIFPSHFRKVLLVLIVASFSLCLHKTFARPVSAFYMIESRAWELLLGAALAVFGVSIFKETKSSQDSEGKIARNWKSELSGWLGVAFIALGFLFSDENTGFPGWIALAPTTGAALLIYCVLSGTSTFSMILSTKPFASVGKISYSLYLWHWPAIVFAKYQFGYLELPLLSGAIAGGVASIGIAVLAYFFIEKPLRKRGAGRKKRFAVIISIFATVLVLCVFLQFKKSPPSIFDPIVSSGRLYSVAAHAKPGAFVREEPGAGVGGKDVVFRVWDTKNGFADPSAKEHGVNHFYGNASAPKVVIWGSSHALMYSKLVDELCRERQIPVSFWGWDGKTLFGYSPVAVSNREKTENEKFRAARLQMLKQWRPDVLFLIGRWDGEFPVPGKLEALERLLEEIKDLPTRIVFVEQVPTLRFGKRENLRAMIQLRLKPDGVLPAIYPGIKEPIRKQVHAAAGLLAEKNSRLHILHPDPLFFKPDGSVFYAEGRKFFYTDEDHLSDAGADLLRPLFAQELTK